MIYTFSFALIVLAGLVTSRRNRTLTEFTVDNTMALRGVLAVSILLFHYICFFPTRWKPLFDDSGYYICSAFFLFSGYGLAKSWQRRGDDYLRHYWRGRLSTLLPVWLFSSIVCPILRNKTDIWQLLHDWIINGDTLNPFTWFINVLILCYLSFYLSARLLKRPAQVVIALWLLTIGQIVLLSFTDRGNEWYISQLALPIGFTIACYEHMINKRHLQLAAIACAIGYCAAYLLFGLSEYTFVGITAASLFGILLYIMVRFGITFSIKPLRYLGSISLEIYVLQGISFTIMNENHINHPYAFYLTFFGSIVAAAGFHALTCKIKECLHK